MQHYDNSRGYPPPPPALTCSFQIPFGIREAFNWWGVALEIKSQSLGNKVLSLGIRELRIFW